MFHAFNMVSVLFFFAHFSCSFDSWAGMALARASRIQDKLNSNELKNDGPIWRPALAVLACFHRALQLQSNCLPLWIEAGATSYALHSLASRQRRMPGASSATVTQVMAASICIGLVFD